MEWWWMAPGIMVVGASIAMTLASIALAIVKRPMQRLSLAALRLRQIGIGLVLLGLGGSVMLSALDRGPDVGVLIIGGLAAGMGGLYFISATDPMFKGGPIPGWPLPKPKGKPKDLDDAGSS